MTLLGDSMLMLPWDRCNLMHHFISKIVMFTVAHQGKMMSPPKLFLCQWNKELTELMCFVTKMTVGRYITQCCSLQKKWRRSMYSCTKWKLIADFSITTPWISCQQKPARAIEVDNCSKAVPNSVLLYRNSAAQGGLWGKKQNVLPRTFTPCKRYIMTKLHPSSNLVPAQPK